MCSSSIVVVYLESGHCCWKKMLVHCIFHVILLSLTGYGTPQPWEDTLFFLDLSSVALVEFGRLVLLRNSLWSVFIKYMIRLLSQVIMVTLYQLSVPTDELWESSPVLCLHKQESHRKNLNYKHILGRVVLAQQSTVIRGMHCCDSCLNIIHRAAWMQLHSFWV
jgi:hypothetical protein